MCECRCGGKCGVEASSAGAVLECLVRERWSWAQYYKCKCAPCLSASPRRDMRSSILLPACLIGLVADRVKLAPSFGEYDLVRRNSHREQRIANGNSAFVGKCEIVDDSSPLIRVAFDRNDAIGMRLQPLSISLEHGLLLRSNVVAIEGEMDVLYILFHCLLLRRSWN